MTPKGLADRAIKRGIEELCGADSRTVKDSYAAALTSAICKVCIRKDILVKLTYKTSGAAILQHTRAIDVLVRMKDSGMSQARGIKYESSTFPNIELDNGSGILFIWEEE